MADKFRSNRECSRVDCSTSLYDWNFARSPITGAIICSTCATHYYFDCKERRWRYEERVTLASGIIKVKH